MKKADAKQEILRLFRMWAEENEIMSPTQKDAFSFFGDLNKEHSHALNFRCSGDKWQVVKGWLINSHLIST